MIRSELSPRERVMRTCSFREPDRVPIDFGGDQTGINVKAYKRLIEYLGIQEDIQVMHDMGQVAEVSESVLQRFHVDTRYLFPDRIIQPKIKEVEREGTVYEESRDEWGVVRRKPKHYGHWFDIAHHPLHEATCEDLLHYPWPDPCSPERFQSIKEKTLNLHKNTDYAIATPVSGSLFETGWYLCGMERFLSDMSINPAFVERLLDSILDFWLRYYQVYLREVGEFIHFVNLGDDLGTQAGPLFSSDFYRLFLKPRQRELFRYIHNHTDARIWFHSCGSVEIFLSDLIDIGVDIINPVQTTARNMEAKYLKKEYGQKIVFWGGGCDTQHVLPFGDPREVDEDVKNRMQIFGPGGGYVFTQIHDIPVEAPPRNVVAMFDAARKYGVYPM